MMEENQTTASEQPSQQPVSQPTEEQSWITSLPADLQENDSLKKFSSLESLAKSYVNAEKMIGADKIIKPNQNYTDDDWSNFYTAAGRPDEPGNYTLNYETENPDALNAYKAQVHSLGLNDKQAQGILDYYKSMEEAAQKTMAANFQEANHKAELDLRNEFGQQFNEKIVQSKQAAQTFASEEILNMELKDGTRLADNPNIIKMFAGIADKMGEDVIRTESDASTVSVAAIEKELSELTMPGTAYWNKTHPDHDKIVERVLALREQRPSPEAELSFQQ